MQYMRKPAIQTAFDSVFNKYYAGLCMYCCSLTGDSQIAEDLVQDVFVNVWMKRAELVFDETIRPYLYRAVHNADIQYLRREKERDRFERLFKIRLAKD